MQQIVTLEQMKLMENLSVINGVSYDMLMVNAGQKLADTIIKYVSDLNIQKNILFLCGCGNNAGDCFVAANILFENGFKTSVALLCGSPKSSLALKYFFKLHSCIHTTDNIDDIKNLVASVPVVADGVFGTGFHGSMDSVIQNIFHLSKNAQLKIAVDVPSGGDCISGCVSDGIFNSDITVTFAFPKFGMMQYPLHDYCGEIIPVDIGISDDIVKQAIDIPIYLLDDDFVVSNVLPRPSLSHKGNFGKQLNICGSNRMSGACMLAGKAALRSGIGLLISATTHVSADRTSVFIPEGMTFPLDADENGFVIFEKNYSALLECAKSASALLVGCGLGVTNDTKKLVKNLLKDVTCPVILDADGINCIVDCVDILKNSDNLPVTLTPHPAEMARLMHTSVSEIMNDRLGAAFSFSKQYNCITVLKGAGTVIASSDRVYVNLTGNPGMSCGGCGDVLAGMTASFIAQGYDCLTASALAVFIHGKAGDLAKKEFSEVSMLPSDIVDFISLVFSSYGL